MGEQFAWVFDVLVIVVLIVSVYMGAKRGFLRSLVLLIGNIAAILLSLWLSAGISAWIYDNWVEAEIVGGMTEKLEAMDGEHTFEQVTEDLLSLLPDSVAGMLEDYIKFDEGAFESIESALDNTNQEIADSVAKSVVEPMVVFLLRVLVFALLTALFMIAVHWVARLLGVVNSIPIIGGVNSVLGAVLGLLEGAITLALIVIIIRAAVVLTSGELIVLNEPTIEQSRIFAPIYGYDIFDWIH